MKKFIKNRRYDTASAHEIAQSVTGSGDAAEAEVLYRKITGEYFLHVSGGIRTRYARSVNGKWQPSEAIIPLSPGGAKEWARKSLSSADFERFFGSKASACGSRYLHLRLSAEAAACLYAAAQARGSTQSALACEIIEDHVSEYLEPDK